MAEKKYTISAAVPYAIQGPEGKALNPLERIRRTFETGVVSADLPLRSFAEVAGERAGLEDVTRALRTIPDWVWKMDKDISKEFGGKLTIHAPESIVADSPIEMDQAQSADALKMSLEVADKLGAGSVTFHLSGNMGWPLRNPLSGTIEQLPAHVAMPEPIWELVKKNLEKEKQYTIANSLEEERKLTRRINLLQWRQRFFFEAPRVIQGQIITDTQEKLYHEATSDKSYDEKKELINSIFQQADEQGVRAERGGPFGRQLEQQMRLNAKKWYEDGDTTFKEFDPHRPDDVKKFFQKRFELMREANPEELKEYKNVGEMLKNDQIDNLRRRALIDGGFTTEIAGKERDAQQIFFELPWEEELRKQGKSEDYIDELRKNPEKIIKDQKMMQDLFFKPFMDNFEETLRRTLADPEVKEILKKGDTKLLVENIFGPNFKYGQTQGFLMGWHPSHIVEALRRAQKVAQDYGISPDVFGTTFDTQHALVVPEELGAKSDPEWFWDELKKNGITPKHVHLVGGNPRSSDAHVGVGDIADEVMRKHPGIIDKLAEAGVLEIEPGRGAMTDIETALETMGHKGIPPMAMAAAGGAPGGAELIGYSARPNSFYEGAYGNMQASVWRGQFYAFSNPMERSAWQFAMANTWYGWPTMATMGGVTQDIQKSQQIWSKYQPY